MSGIRLQKPESSRAEIHLPASKSISNRLLIMQSLEKGVQIEHLSEANDTRVLQRGLKSVNSPNCPINLEDAGTAFRFLLARLAMENASFYLTGSLRLRQRPIKALANALISLGAEIVYENAEGFLPLRIKGGKLFAPKLSVDAGCSSQFVTALMLIAPYLHKGLHLSLMKNAISLPYIKMTAALMERAGALVQIDDIDILIEEQAYKPTNIKVERDWSAASYFYLMVAFSGEQLSIFLKGLFIENSVQGDSGIVGLFRRFGVKTIFVEDGLIIEKDSSVKLPGFFEFDFSGMPDMAQTIAVLCAGLKVRARLSGLSTLVHKETNRLIALQIELSKFGVSSRIIENHTMEIGGEKPHYSGKQISTWQDHRMAMSFAPLALLGFELKMDEISVVKKSFPTFWQEAEKVGLSLFEE